MKKIVMVGIKDKVCMKNMLNSLENTLASKLNIFQESKGELLIDYDNHSQLVEKYLIINIDIHEEMNLNQYKGYNIITIGFNKKSSLTVSSVEDEEIAFCLQREIKVADKKIEPQEFVYIDHHINNKCILNKIFFFTLLLLTIGTNSNSIKKYF